ncbi:hypothetical protein [Methanogenium cariaci]|uniref:hypothetical protein n=1 Tax=Methanogenium cariaci TaxID=2197 RepID=UPI001FE03F1C|nr:hypothetical protein [Methanogenium cariaci]
MKLELPISTRTRLFLTGFVALLICAFAASAAGIYLGSARDVLSLLPGLMVMVPPRPLICGGVYPACWHPASPHRCIWGGI